MRRILITGANSGFGYLSTLEFARKGDYVYATTRNLKNEGVLNINEKAKNENLNIEWLVLDITKEKEIEKVVEYVKKNGLDVLVNNAGYGEVGPIELLTMEQVRKQMETNYFGTVNLTKQLIPYFREKREGRIITVASIAGRVAAPLYGVYSASKYAVEGFFEALRTELYSFNVKVSMVEPGAFKTGFGKNMEENIISLVKGTDYENWYERMEKSRDLWSSNSNNSHLNNLRKPDIVSRTIYRVSRLNNPSLRYTVGIDAFLISLVKKVLPDRLYVYIVNKLMG